MRRDGATVDRRTVLQTLGAVTAGTALAGCTGGNDNEPSGGGGGSDGSGGGDSGGDGSGGGGSPPTAVENWMSDVGNYDGVVDRTGKDSVTVEVGAQGNGGAFAFAPPAVAISAGTTVTWEWTGEGGQHNVVADGGSFGSELVSEAGHTFEHTFESAGTFKYLCEPHKSLGMKGAVVVE